MGYCSVIQQIRRKDGRRQLYVNVPAEMAAELGLQAGQSVAWMMPPRAAAQSGRKAGGDPPQRPGGKKGGSYC